MATIVSSALAAAGAKDLTFQLTLANDEPQPVVACAKAATFDSVLPSWRGELRRADAPKQAPTPIFRRMRNPPAPPWAPNYLRDNGTQIKPGASLVVRLDGCWLPRAALPAEPQLRASILFDGAPGDLRHTSVLVIGRRCQEVLQALLEGADRAFEYQPLAVIAGPGAYELTFSYDEHAGFGFVPSRPLHLAAPPVRLDLTAVR